MVTHRFSTAFALVLCAATLPACYEDNCEVRVTCPGISAALDPPAEEDVEPDPDPDPDPGAGSQVMPVNLGVELPECNDDLEVQTACGVFVSTSMGDDSHSFGTRKAPVKTLSRAVEIAKAHSRVIYACAEIFEGDVVLPAGFVLIGGLLCEEDWIRGENWERTEIAGAPGDVPLLVAPTDASGENTIVQNVHFHAADAYLPGQSSVSVRVADGASVKFQNCDFDPGWGMPGADGKHGSVIEEPAPGGEHGVPGGLACQGWSPKGGHAVYTICGLGSSVGGFGGDGAGEEGMPGMDGTPDPDPEDLMSGLGGEGQTASLACTPGQPGAVGTDGADGAGAIAGLARLQSLNYVGVAGGNGGLGLPGQGGGGGGGGRGGQLCGVKPGGGAGGGSGGSGGCGGLAGFGGGAGGGSIAIIMGAAKVILEGGILQSHDGSPGGNGGRGQVGGPGGAGGIGGFGQQQSPSACAGGHGGAGGRGGHGGGGLGGPSIGVAYSTVEPLLLGVELAIGAPGPGGEPGDPYLKEIAGAKGLGGETVQLLPPPG
ncbi:MAG: PGRS family protein [Polyangiaceae bacterium]